MTTRPLRAITAATVLAVVVATAVSAQDELSDGPVPAPEATPLAVPPEQPAGSGTGVRLATDEGDIVIALYDESAPVASESFLNLTRAGFYDGLTFHRIAPDFVIEGGDPYGDGTGDAGYTLPDEPVVGAYERGTVALSRSPEPDSGGSQFFIVLSDEAGDELEAFRTFTIFGQVVEGMEVVDAIAGGESSGAPDYLALDPVSIETATVEAVAVPATAMDPEPVSIVGSLALESVIPDAIGDLPLETGSYSGDQIVAGAVAGDPIDELERIAVAHGASVSDYAVAFASADDGDSFVGILGVTLAGVPAESVAEELAPIILGASSEAAIDDALVAGRAVLTVGPGTELAPEDTIYVLASGDVLWLTVASDDLLEEAIAALP